MSFRLGENDIDDLEADFERIFETLVREDQQALQDPPIVLPLENFLNGYNYTGGRSVSFKVHQLMAVRPIPELDLPADGNLTEIYMDIVCTTDRTTLSRYCVENCTVSVDTNTIRFGGPTWNRLYEPLPESESVIPNSHIANLNNGYSLDGYIVRIHRRG